MDLGSPVTLKFSEFSEQSYCYQSKHRILTLRCKHPILLPCIMTTAQETKFTTGGSSMFMRAKQTSHAQDCTRLWDLEVCMQTYCIGFAQQLSHLWSSGLLP